jgi:hypothetical protein
MRAALVFTLGVFLCGCRQAPTPGPFTIQLNWLHDPTFAGEYRLAQMDSKVQIRPGGPGITPLAEVQGGRVQAAVVGADIFLQGVEADLKTKGASSLVCFFVDFQRNPVGWVLHPEAAKRAGYTDDLDQDPKKRNAWLFRQLTAGKLRLGDKRGTETTAIWVQWKQKHALPATVTVVPVGFDTSVVLSAPDLAYPVYLNEEPYKLTEKVGRPVVVFDPADDGVLAYGNVLVTTRSYLDANGDRIEAIRKSLASSWDFVRQNVPTATRLVMTYYKDVSESVVAAQVRKTTEFVFFDQSTAGQMDLQPGGRWDTTINGLRGAGIMGEVLSLERLKGSYISTN